MRETIFITEIKNSIVGFGGWAYKLPDFPQSMLIGSRFNPEKPFDLSCSIKGKAVGIECKQLKKVEAFGLRHIRESQVRGLDDIVRSGGRGFVFLNIRQKANKEKNLIRLNLLIIFDWETWKSRWEIGTSKKGELMELPFVSGHLGLFPLQHWINQIG